MFVKFTSRFLPSLLSVPFHKIVFSCRNLSLNTTKNLTNLNNNTIILSQSHDIFENLALEDWLYENYDFSSKDISILLMWYNGPSVVIGRHQNPWLECSVQYCNENGIEIARRNSGGGTVYHDFGNLNLSFLTSRKKYNRKHNLELICQALNSKWPLCLQVTKRDDIICNDLYKVSGTASKLGRNNAYHHCTLLINVDSTKLHSALHRELEGVESKATSSVRAKITNLGAEYSEINVVDVIEAVKETYMKTYNLDSCNVLHVSPKDVPGVNDLKEKFTSWDWKFGRTPRFTISRTFPIPSDKNNLNFDKIKIIIAVNKGVFESISIDETIHCEDVLSLNTCMVGMKFSDDIEGVLEKWTFGSNADLKYFLKDCILQMVNSVFR